MNNILLANTQLFQSMSEGEIQSIINSTQARKRNYKKGEIIYLAGNTICSIGMVLSGKVQVENDDIWGNKSMLDTVEPGNVFAEAYAFMPQEPLMVSVIASQDCEILFIDINSILKPDSCNHNTQLIKNLLSISSQKNLNLSRRIFHTSSKSIRGRVLSYLSYQASLHRTKEFTISLSRQQLANYLSVDRSALSNELSKMQKDGLIKVNRNHFSIIA